MQLKIPCPQVTTFA